MTRKTKIIIGIILIFIVWLCLYWILLQPPPRTYDYDWPGKAEVAERMKYHGIEACECDGKGCWFVRDGKKCRL